MTDLNPDALEKAAEVYDLSYDHDYSDVEMARRVVTAYLAALPTTGLAARLGAWADDIASRNALGQIDSTIVARLLREAASALSGWRVGAVRDAALEEAAKVAERNRTMVIGNDEWEGGRNEALSEVAIELRALKESP